MAYRQTIAILYHMRGTYPLRSAIESHLYAWKKYSRHRVVHVNAALADAVGSLAAVYPDVIIVHTSFCGIRWNPSEYERLEPIFDQIGQMSALKIAQPQDEYYLVKPLRHMLERLCVSVVLSCADAENWPILYPDLVGQIEFRTVLTGYLDDNVVQDALRWSKPTRLRQIFVSYRASDTGYWLGEHGAHKTKVGEAMRAALGRRRLANDISMDAKHTIEGKNWLRFLGNSRATIGVEGGASIIDPDGSVKACIDCFVADNPEATLDEVRQTCFPKENVDFKLACLSPRHLEAIATRTAQALVRGKYNGILEADRHYIPIESDYSNLDAVIDNLQDGDAIATITEQAYRDIVKSGKYSYRSFVAEVDSIWVDTMPISKSQSSIFSRLKLSLLDWLHWKVIQLECIYGRYPAAFKILAFLKPMYHHLIVRR
jgi:hypothetical protein